jgi:hypothetical protein
MPNLNQESKLITPSQALFFVVLGSIFAIWYWDVDLEYHLGNIRETIHHVTAGIL